MYYLINLLIKCLLNLNKTVQCIHAVKIINQPKKEEQKMQVLLKNETAGYIEACKVGETVTIKAHDENGNFIYVTGEVIDILEDATPY